MQIQFKLFVSDFVETNLKNYTLFLTLFFFNASTTYAILNWNEVNVTLQNNNGKYKPSNFHCMKNFYPLSTIDLV